jgi:predicted MFS family arabinose efflux permease
MCACPDIDDSNAACAASRQCAIVATRWLDMTSGRASTDFSAARGDLGGRWAYLAVAGIARAALGFQFQAMPALGLAIGAGLGLTLVEIGTLTGLYMLPGVVVALIAGAVLQRVSVRNALVVALALIALAGMLASASASFAMLAAARLLGGVGAVVVAVTTLKGVFDRFEQRDLPLANGILGGTQPFGMGIALLAFGALGTAANWRAAFVATAVAALVALCAGLLVMSKETPAPSTQHVSAALDRGEWTGLVLVGAVVVHFVGCYYAFLSFFPMHLAAFDWEPAAASLALGCLGWAPIFVAPIGGWLIGRTGQPMILAAVSIAVWGGAVIAAGLGAPSLPLLILMLVFGPVPIGLVMSLPARVTTPEHRGTASGFFMASMFAGTASFPFLAAWVGELTAGPELPAAAAAVTFSGAAFLLALVPLAFIARRDRRSQ